jgi:hypothetical protein
MGIAISVGGGMSEKGTGHNSAVMSVNHRGAQYTMSHTCETARRAIESRHFIGWHGLPPKCTPDALFGLALNDQWGEMPLGNSFEPARSRLLEIGGYYRPMAYVRNGAVTMFDGMNPTLSCGWTELSDDLGTPEAKLDWIHGAVKMTGGERVHAGRGITVFINPENDFVIHVSLYVPATVEEYIRRLRLTREKRQH